MPGDDAIFTTALAHYRTLNATWLTAWTDRDSSGTTWAGTVVTEWQAEYDAVSAVALDETLVTSSSLSDGNAAGIANCPPAVRLRALQEFRAELQPAYATALRTPAKKPRARAGFVIRFGPHSA